jgi:UDP-N-acetylglucosamine diphosphorylase/glucosamine-1-phosphate N-acetyltransferase
MDKNLWPITLTRKISDIHSGGFSAEEEKALGFAEGELFEIPTHLHELIMFHKKNLGRNLELYKEKVLKNNPEYKEIQKGVYQHTSTLMHEQVVFNSNDGIIVIEKDVKVEPFTYLVGPLRIDEGVMISAHSNIANTYIGKFSKVGGEIKNTVFEGFSNKVHHGFLGDAYVGSWVNIGAGATFSNMKNTLGTIKLSGIETGDMHIGPIVADYVKVAINASIYTAKIIGVNAHLYGTVTEDVPSFTNYLNKDNLVLLPIDMAVTTAERMCTRRNITLSEEARKVLSYAYTQTEDERKLRGVKEGKLQF